MDNTDGPGERETRGVTSILPVWQWRCTQHVTDVTLHRSYPRLGLALSECKQWSGPCLFMSRFKKSIAAEDADVRGCAQFAGVKVYMGLTSRAVDLNQSRTGERRLFSRPVYHA